ncbi:MAG: hypothetical protein AB2L20_27935 [Mangrovibacterium sp.]
MKKIKVLILLYFVFSLSSMGQNNNQSLVLLNNVDLEFLKGMTRDILESSRI